MEDLTKHVTLRRLNAIEISDPELIVSSNNCGAVVELRVNRPCIRNKPSAIS